MDSKQRVMELLGVTDAEFKPKLKAEASNEDIIEALNALADIVLGGEEE